MRTSAIVRCAAPEWNTLREILFSRYPELEWATFARFGWRETTDQLVVTLATIDPPSGSDLDDRVGHVAISEPYSLRMALGAEKHSLAVGVIHSHPENCPPVASAIDDDMDSYYSSYLEGFAPDRPYISLIASTVRGDLSLGGRIFWRGEWLPVQHFAVERTPSTTWASQKPVNRQGRTRERTRRLASAFGDEAADRLRRSTVAVIGAGGTGSAAIETLARAGVGKLIIVDPESIGESNLERVHGSCPDHVRDGISKVALAKEHVRAIDDSCVVQGFVGSLPQQEVVDALVTADVALGCTDQQHSRLALSDIAIRYLIPAIDCGVLLEGKDGKVTAQVIQLVRLLAADPCVLCRGMINPTQIAQELMTDDEREQRRRAAMEAESKGQDGNPYWHNLPQLNTVGYLTTMAGALAAGYVIGWLAGRFDPPFERLQMNLVASYFDVTDNEQTPRPQCSCRRIRGWADQGNVDALVTPPRHWPTARLV